MKLLRIVGTGACLALLTIWALGPTEFDVPIAVWLAVGLFAVPLSVGGFWFFWWGIDRL